MSTVVVAVGEADALLDEDTEDVRRQVDGQDDEVDPVVVVEHVDSQAGVVHRLALRPQQTCAQPDNESGV